MSIVKAYGTIAENTDSESTAYLTTNKVSELQQPTLAIVDTELRNWFDECEYSIAMNAKPVLSFPNWSHETEFYVVPIKQGASVGIRTPKSMAVRVAIDLDLSELKRAAAMLLAAIRNIENANQD